MKKIVLLSFMSASVLMAGGYKIPELSLNAVALSAANIAQNHSADAAYYNPANMVFMSDAQRVEADLMYIGLNAPNYKATGVEIDAKDEKFIVPSVHYVSGKAGEARVGLSVISPAGLSKRWSDAPAVYSAEEFTLQTVEINPSVAIPIGDKAALACGFRIISSEGIVKSTSPIASRDMSGSSLDYAYNLAWSYKPTSALDIALTYRSQVNLTEEGDATLSFRDMTNRFGGGAGALYTSQSGSTVTIPIPATISAAVAYTFASQTTVEVVYEKNMWSAYNQLDFDYSGSVNPVTNIVFGTPVTKDWKDTTVYRLGITQELDAFTLMAGAVIDETPVPEETFSFELPDSNSLSLSLGGRYKIDEQLSVGLAGLYSMRESRSVTNSSILGEFTNANVLLVSAGLEYKF